LLVIPATGTMHYVHSTAPNGQMCIESLGWRFEAFPLRNGRFLVFLLQTAMAALFLNQAGCWFSPHGRTGTQSTFHSFSVYRLQQRLPFACGKRYSFAFPFHLVTPSSHRMSTNERFENFHLNCEKPRGVLKAFLVEAEVSLGIAFNCAI